MKRNEYESPYCKIFFMQEQDIIADSSFSVEEADDLGGWNNNWFANKND